MAIVPILKSRRLILRPQEEADAPSLFAILSDAHAMRFWNRSTIAHLAVVQDLVAEQQAAMADGLCCYWTVTEDGEAIGSVDISLIQDDSAELGFLLRTDRWGLGLASEAVATVIGYGFQALHLTRLAAAVQTANHAAARVLEKNGFVRIETRSALLADGQKRDCTFYLLSRWPMRQHMAAGMESSMWTLEELVDRTSRWGHDIVKLIEEWRRPFQPKRPCMDWLDYAIPGTFIILIYVLRAKFPDKFGKGDGGGGDDGGHGGDCGDGGH